MQLNSYITIFIPYNNIYVAYNNIYGSERFEIRVSLWLNLPAFEQSSIIPFDLTDGKAADVSDGGDARRLVNCTAQFALIFLLLLEQPPHKTPVKYSPRFSYRPAGKTARLRQLRYRIAEANWSAV